MLYGSTDVVIPERYFHSTCFYSAHAFTPYFLPTIIYLGAGNPDHQQTPCVTFKAFSSSVNDFL